MELKELKIKDLYKLIDSITDLECKVIALHSDVIELVHIAEDLRYKINELVIILENKGGERWKNL